MNINRLMRITFFIFILIPTVSILNTVAFDFDPGVGGDTTPPSLNFNAPSAGATVSGYVTIIVTATDSGDGMDYVKFYIDSIYLGMDSTPSTNVYSLSFSSINYIDGSHTLKAKAYDTAGNYAIKTLSIYLLNYGPFVNWITPISGGTLDGVDGDFEEILTVQATDSDSSIGHVNFYIGSTLIDSDYDTSDSYFSINFDFSSYLDGSYTLKAKAYDLLNHVKEETINVIIEKSGKPIDGVDPEPIAHPLTESYDWLNDAARHPSNSIMISMARRATGYGIRKMMEDEIDMNNWSIYYKYTRAISRFTGDFLGSKWNGDDDAKDDLTVASLFTNFYSWMEVSDINLGSITVDCRDVSAFVTGMAMAMGLKARMISCEYGNQRHVAAEILDYETRNYGYGSTNWYIISLFGYYVDALSPIDNIRLHLSGLSSAIQEVYHIISSIANWNIPRDTYPYQETGWVGWYLDCQDPNDPYDYRDPYGEPIDPPYTYYSNPIYFSYYINDPYGIDWSGSPYPDLPEDYL
ncbi:MAG: Ig-like domain-containing protein [Candidatus Thorarchaeota archaeon]